MPSGQLVLTPYLEKFNTKSNCFWLSMVFLDHCSEPSNKHMHAVNQIRCVCGGWGKDPHWILGTQKMNNWLWKGKGQSKICLISSKQKHVNAFTAHQRSEFCLELPMLSPPAIRILPRAKQNCRLYWPLANLHGRVCGKRQQSIAWTFRWKDPVDRLHGRGCQMQIINMWVVRD